VLVFWWGLMPVSVQPVALLLPPEENPAEEVLRTEIITEAPPVDAASLHCR